MKYRYLIHEVQITSSTAILYIHMAFISLFTHLPNNWYPMYTTLIYLNESATPPTHSKIQNGR